MQDVHEVPGHIACDASTECEIVVPLIYRLPAELPGIETSKETSTVALGVLDIDCQRSQSWSQEDVEGLGRIVHWLMQPDGVVDWHSAI